VRRCFRYPAFSPACSAHRLCQNQALWVLHQGSPVPLETIKGLIELSYGFSLPVPEEKECHRFVHAAFILIQEPLVTPTNQEVLEQIIFYGLPLQRHTRLQRLHTEESRP
jgi:hypothetical protein